MRIFIAVEFDPEIKKRLSDFGKTVEENSKRGNFTSEDNFHLTVKFIGEITKDELLSVYEAAYEAAARSRSFELKFGRLGFFPRGRRSIVWLGIEESRGLNSLFANMEKSLQKQGFPREKRGFNPHITLGREVELTKSFDSVKEMINAGGIEMKAAKVSVMESRREGGRLVYRALKRYDLKDGGNSSYTG